MVTTPSQTLRGATSRGKGRVMEGRATREETLLSSETSVPGTSRMGSTILGPAL